MSTPDEWRRRAAEYARQAIEATEAGDAEEAIVKDRAAYTARQVADKLEAEIKAGRLPGRDQRGSKKGMGMVNAARVRISAGADGDPDELVARANAAGYTLRSLAEAVKCSHVLLSQARRGVRSIRRQIVDDVERLTGFKATRAHWPRIRD